MPCLLYTSVIDCPDLPLNVSRSALQNDGFVKKISDYITKKVADKLSGMCKTDRENYEKYWDDIAPFIKFGYIKDEKFAEKMGDYILYKNLEGKYLTLNDCLEENKEKHENTIFYVTNEKEQLSLIHICTDTDCPEQVGRGKGESFFICAKNWHKDRTEQEHKNTI